MKRNQFAKDKQKRRSFEKFELKRLEFLSIRNNLSLDDQSRYKAQLELSCLPKNSSFSRIRNRCIYTSRSRGVYRDLGISRILLREFCGKRFIPGVRKSSW
uniref:Ribosomal protein S14 n=1 Tax=Jakoba bahamiensis TaxID=221721 RepID=M4QDA3_9EUKA|nr:ribosomal protein S14 [Jakoba bahamiensis]AGH24160.1 ribosomal protein S14 [Jakoba bahamiensis]